jgi:hypothetical protein
VSIPTRCRAPRFQDALGRPADYPSGGRPPGGCPPDWPSRGESNSRPRGSEPRALSTELRDKDLFVVRPGGVEPPTALQSGAYDGYTNQSSV